MYVTFFNHCCISSGDAQNRAYTKCQCMDLLLVQRSMIHTKQRMYISIHTQYNNTLQRARTHGHNIQRESTHTIFRERVHTQYLEREHTHHIQRESTYTIFRERARVQYLEREHTQYLEREHAHNIQRERERTQYLERKNTHNIQRERAHTQYLERGREGRERESTISDMCFISLMSAPVVRARKGLQSFVLCQQPFVAP